MISVDSSDVKTKLEKAIKLASATEKEFMQEIGLRGVGILKFNTPVKTGRLRASNSYTTGNDVESPLNPLNPEDVIRPINNERMTVIGTNVIYGPRVEYFAKGASKGYMLRSYNHLKRTIPELAKQLFKKRGF